MSRACFSRIFSLAILPIVGLVFSGCSLVDPEARSSPGSGASMMGYPSPRIDEYGSRSPTTTAPPSSTTEGASPARTESGRLVGVFYATDRKPYSDATKDPYFLGEPSITEYPVQYGKCYVSIPPSHEPGVLETPRWWKFEFEENPDKHVMIKSAHPLDPRSFFRELGSRAAEANARRGKGKQALLFVHGFNTSFETAIRRTGQLAWDLDFPGVPITYSWPSVGRLTKYRDDEKYAEWAKPHLANVLINLQENTDIEKIHVIAHSMGTRVLTGAILEAKELGYNLNYSNIILAAADIGADDFRSNIFPRIQGTAGRLTLYSNSNDRALQISSHLNSAPRLGRSGRNIVVIPGMDTIDATRVDRSFVGHEYFGGNSLMLRDLNNLIVFNESPQQRRLQMQSNGAWRFFK